MNGVRREAATRAALFVHGALTSLFCLLCSVDFVWNNFLRDRRYPHWVELFLRGHGALSLALAALGASALRGRTRAAWGLSWGALAAYAAATGWLAARGHSSASLILAFASWLPYASWEIAMPVPSGNPRSPRLPGAAATAGAALFCAAIYAAPYAIAVDGAIAAAWSAVVLLELFLTAALTFDALSAACAAAPRPRFFARAARRILVWLVLSKVLAWTLTTVSFSGPTADAYASLAAAAILLAVWRLPRVPRALARPSRRRAAAALAALAFVPWAARAAFGRLDWNRLGQSAVVVAVALAAAGLWRSLLPPPRGAARRRALWAGAAVVVCAAWLARAASISWAAPLRRRGIELDSAVLRLQEDDVAFATARRVLPDAAGGGGFYAYLVKNTNLRRAPGRGSRVLEPAPTADAAPSRARRPHIFVIVIDSLRSDYLGVYNPKAFFTPRIDAFARDAIVFRRAFSAYGGTGLSEPSLWAGARLPHMQYPSPFAPMNALEKLVDREGYRPLITIDALLGEILKPDKRAHALDRATTGSYKLCPTLDELQGRLDRELATGRPLFVYTQPQDIHISVIHREGARPVDAHPYPGFYAPYASRLAAMDACFGRFIDTLKERGVYDDSIIILTADHGDSLGEHGRWGHAYTIFPEILKVPLIMKIPRRLLAGRVWNPDAAAYLTDVTPTLYSLLGREPTNREEPYGRPLLARSSSQLAADARAWRVVASSYGPVYGTLEGNARVLTIFDAVNHRSYVFDLERDPAGNVPLSDPSALARAQERIRASLTALKAFFGY